MMVDEFLAKWNERIGQQKLDLLAIVENHKFEDLASFNSIQGRVQGLNMAFETMRKLYDGIFVPKDSIIITNEGAIKDDKPTLY